METHFARQARRLRLSDRQHEIVLGSLLGDATLLATTRGYCFRVHHGVQQRALADWKYAELRTLVRTPPRVSGRGYYFRTVSHDAFTALRRSFYVDRRKVVPLPLLHARMTPLALAVWIMDDGAADGNALRINTQSFSIDECTDAIDLLHRKFGLSFTMNMDKGKPRLRCRARSVGRLGELVRPHMIPEMQYKLPDAGATSGRRASLLF